MSVMAENTSINSFSKDESFSNTSEEDFKKDSSYSHPTIPADELYGISKPENDVSTTTSAKYCSNSQYSRDVFLVYDPVRDFYNAQSLLKEIEPLNLSILDINRDASPGIPATKFFANALKQCRYTCIVVSRQFMDNFWITFKADMAIENMLEDESKQYTGRLIIVAMDSSLKVNELPLDLRTISPICLSERYFKTRLLRAFQGPIFGQLSTSSNLTKSSSLSSSSFPSTPHQPCGIESNPTTCTEASCEPSASRYPPESFRSSVDYSSSKSSEQESSHPQVSHEYKLAIHDPPMSFETPSLSSQSSENVPVTSFPPVQDLTLSTNISSQSKLQSLSLTFEQSCAMQERPNVGFASPERFSEYLPSSQERSFSSLGNNSPSSSSSDLYSASCSALKKKPIFSKETKNGADLARNREAAEDNDDHSILSEQANSGRSPMTSIRTPQEHTENIPSPAQVDGVVRMISVTRNSTGLRQPTEGDDSSESGNSFNQTALPTMQFQSDTSFPERSRDLNKRETTGSIPRSSSNNNSALAPNNSRKKRVLPASSSNHHDGNSVFSSLIQSVDDEILVDDSIEHYNVEISDEELPRARVNVSLAERRTPSPQRSTRGSSVNLSESLDSLGASIRASVKSLFK